MWCVCVVVVHLVCAAMCILVATSMARNRGVWCAFFASLCGWGADVECTIVVLGETEIPLMWKFGSMHTKMCKEHGVHAQGTVHADSRGL